jgi:hypothetical protein
MRLDDAAAQVLALVLDQHPLAEQGRISRRYVCNVG